MKKVDLKLTGEKEEHLAAIKSLGFGHVASRIDSLWDTQGLNAYFNQIVVDYRGNRSGFPEAVFTHIMRLFVLHNVEDETFKLDPWATHFYK